MDRDQTPAASEALADGEEPPFFIIARLFPRIAEAIKLMWGERDLDDYLKKLIMADRTERAGFPKEVLAALLKLYNQHVMQFNFTSPLRMWAQEDRHERAEYRPALN